MEAGGGAGRAAAESLLETYEPERIAFARRLVATTDRAFTVVTARAAWRGSSGPDSRRLFRLRDAVGPFAALISGLFRSPHRVSPQRARVSASPVHSTAGIACHGSSYPGEDNFAPFRSLEWQVHVYGELRSDCKSSAMSSGSRFTVSSGGRK